MRLLQKITPQLILLGLWLFVVLIVNPLGEFPLNDDWSYTKSVHTLYYEGVFKLYNWGEMTLVAHVYWGYLFTKLFGFSFTVLRWSTLVFGAGSILGTYAVCRAVHPSKWLAFLAALLCLFNPIFMSLSFSYMTDVPFFCLSVWGFYGFLRFHQAQQIKYLILALFLCIWAFLIRQLALVFPLAWLFSSLLYHPLKIRNVIKAALPLLLMLLFYIGYTSFMHSNGLLQERYNDKLGLLAKTILDASPKLLVNIPGYFFVIVTYLGFFLAPIHWAYLKTNTGRVKPFWYIAYTLLISTLLVLTKKTIPGLDNVLVDFGVGPITLFDHYGNFTQSPSPNAPQWFWWIISAIGVFFSIAWGLKSQAIIGFIRKKQKADFTSLFTFFGAFIYVAPFLIVGIYDRYLIFLIPLVVVLLIHQSSFNFSFKAKVFSLVFSLIIGFFSICATHDLLSWNRVRWEVLTNLNHSGVPLNQIQGGVEFNCWHHYSDNTPQWWKKISPEYTLTFKKLPNYETISEHSYSRWLPGKGTLLLSKKTN